MNIITILAIFLILWGLATFLVGLLRPKAIWNNAKTKGFISLLSEKGTMAFFIIIGLLALAGGVYLLINVA